MQLKELFTKTLVEPNGLQRFIARKLLFRPMEAIGFHIVGDHFYEPIPNLGQLSRNYDPDRFHLPAGHVFDFNTTSASYEAVLENFSGDFLHAVRQTGFCINPYFRMEDAVSLYGVIRHEKIHTVVEIGQGYSTLVALAALRDNRKAELEPTRFISIDPFDRLKSQGHAAVSNDECITLIKKRIQDVDVNELLQLLGEKTLLFVDSSHVFKPGSDVEFLMRNVYSELPPGTFLHIHDIYTPYGTPKERFTKDKLFFSEQDHLESFLDHNTSFHIKYPIFWFYRDNSNLRTILKKYKIPSDLAGNSFYIQRLPALRSADNA